MFERTEPGQNPKKRIHQIPEDVYNFAQTSKSKDSRPRGRGNSNAIRLPDIYLQLIKEGLKLVKPDTVFTHVMKTGLSRGDLIEIPVTVNIELKELQKRLNKEGITPHKRTNLEKDVRVYKEITIVSLAVNLMRLAIQNRQKQAT